MCLEGFTQRAECEGGRYYKWEIRYDPDSPAGLDSIEGQLSFDTV